MRERADVEGERTEVGVGLLGRVVVEERGKDKRNKCRRSPAIALALASASARSFALSAASRAAATAAFSAAAAAAASSRVSSFALLSAARRS